jgi:hypothetical protein
MRTEHEEHMDELALRVGKTLEGETLEDGIMACAACLALGLVQVRPEERAKLRPFLDNFIDRIIAAEADAR